MSTPDFVAALLEADAYEHPCSEIRLVETHISWVVLTGEYAYKIKKPVQFNFVDFSTAALRAHYCEEEVRCNRAFSPELYLGVVTINRDPQGRYRIDGPGDVVEHAVRMLEFPGAQQLDRLLNAGGLGVGAMRRFGADLADQHAGLPRLTATDDEVDTRVLKPVLDNFRTLEPLRASRPAQKRLKRMRIDSQAAYERLQPRFIERLRAGFTRECHGDLHLSNLVLLDGRVRAFDCLEFNANLRWIDTASDVAFLLMDCSVRGRGDLSYAFVDGYLNSSADYEGAALSGFFQVYRSMVRAKVAALQLEELDADGDPDLAARLELHLDWADERLHRQPGVMVLMCGLSGSGKSYLAERLVPHLHAVRVRSDVLRKARAGLAPTARSNSPIAGGLYSEAKSLEVYADMLQASQCLLEAGESVLVDATFLSRAARATFQQAAADIGTCCVIVHCRARQATLEERVRSRERDGDDASEAGLAVLQRQLSVLDPITEHELAIDVDTEATPDIAELSRLVHAACV